MQSLNSEFHWLQLGDVNAYLWTGAGGPSLIDSGYPWTTEKLLQEMRAAGVHPADLKRIIITHADLDHTGGLTYLLEQSPARVCCHTAEAAYVQGQKHKRRRGLGGILNTPIFWFLNWKYQSRIKHIAELVLDGQTLPEGFTVIHTPGHSPGHIALHHKQAGLLITGDALGHRHGKLSLPPAVFTPNMGQAKESLQKFLRLRYDTACFGHGPPLTPNAADHIAAFLQAQPSA
ncbi:MAG: MBL fold metallo-hydrolase [Chloroflexi bacterium]|nr:MBL fold metallo-hydrolase [Chloroflexota bacterium]